MSRQPAPILELSPTPMLLSGRMKHTTTNQCVLQCDAFLARAGDLWQEVATRIWPGKTLKLATCLKQNHDDCDHVVQ